MMLEHECTYVNDPKKQSNTEDKHLSDGDLSELVVLSELFPSLGPNKVV